MRRAVALVVTIGVALAVAASPALADEMTSVYAAIINDPTNTALNLKYAELAEARQDYKAALATYERILVNDPTNATARDGLQRIRRIIDPAKTQKTLEVGATWESNPLLVPDATPDFLGYGSFSVRDERALGEQRWRTNLSLYGEGYANTTSMDYASLAADIGPLIDIPGTGGTFRPALGVGTAYFDGKVYYGDINASGLFEGSLNGAYQWLRLRAGYRQYDPSFTSGAGGYADVTGKFSLAKRLPWARRDFGCPVVPLERHQRHARQRRHRFRHRLYIEGGANVRICRCDQRCPERCDQCEARRPRLRRHRLGRPARLAGGPGGLAHLHQSAGTADRPAFRLSLRVEQLERPGTYVAEPGRHRRPRGPPLG